MIRPVTKHSEVFYFLFFLLPPMKITNLITKICIHDFGLDSQNFPVSLAYKHSSTRSFPLRRAIIARSFSIFAGNSFVWPKKMFLEVYSASRLCTVTILVLSSQRQVSKSEFWIMIICAQARMGSVRLVALGRLCCYCKLLFCGLYNTGWLRWSPCSQRTGS